MLAQMQGLARPPCALITAANILGVAPTASAAEIKKVYLRLVERG
jgi:curved DNA-binding protein CbpA